MVEIDRVLNRLDDIVDLIGQQNVKLSELESRIDSLEQSEKETKRVVERLDTLMRGGDNSTGLLARMSVLEAKMVSPSPKKNGNGSENVTWKWLAENYTSIVISLLIWLLVTVFPKLFEKLGGW